MIGYSLLVFSRKRPHPSPLPEGEGMDRDYLSCGFEVFCSAFFRDYISAAVGGQQEYPSVRMQNIGLGRIAVAETNDIVRIFL